MIRDGQRPTPRFRNHRPPQLFQQRMRIAIGNRHHWNFQNRRGLGARQPLCPRHRRPSGSQRIARINRHVHHAAALRPLRRPHRTVGINVALKIPVVARIGINQAPDSSVLLRQLRLDSSPAMPVPRNDDFALHVDAELFEHLVIFRHAVVHVDQLRRHIARRRIRVERWKLRRIVGIFVPGDGGLFQHGAIANRLRHLQGPRRRIRQQRVECFDMRVEPPFLEQPQRILGHRARPGRPRMMRLRRHPLHVDFHPLALRSRDRFFLAVMLRFPLVAAKSPDRSLSKSGNKEQQSGNDAPHLQEMQSNTTGTG